MVSHFEFPFNHLNLDGELFHDEQLPFDAYSEIIFEPTNYSRSERDENFFNISDGEIDYDHGRLSSCNYSENLQSANVSSNNFFVFFFSNIRTYSKNFPYFSHSYLESETVLPSLIGLCETKIGKSIENIHNFSGYNLVFNSSSSSKGGILFLVKSSVRYEIIDEFNLSLDSIESLFIRINLNGSDLIVGNIYRRPGSNFLEFMHSFETILHRIGNTKCLIGGDLNLDLLKYKSSSHVKTLVD